MAHVGLVPATKNPEREAHTEYAECGVFTGWEDAGFSIKGGDGTIVGLETIGMIDPDCHRDDVSKTLSQPQAYFN